MDGKWEGEHGHAVAAARYGALSWPGASKQPDPIPDDPRARLLWEVERKRDEASYHGRYEWR